MQLHIPSNCETMIAQVSRQAIDSHDSLLEAYGEVDGNSACSTNYESVKG